MILKNQIMSMRTFHKTNYLWFRVLLIKMGNNEGRFSEEGSDHEQSKWTYEDEQVLRVCQTYYW